VKSQDYGLQKDQSGLPSAAAVDAVVVADADFASFSD